MKFRSWGWEDVLKELERLSDQYGINRFFAVDLIIPKEFYTTLLPALAERQRDWSMFYEIKASVGEAEVSALASAGVRWIQPGIESLDDRVLRLMRKGVSALHNVQLLRLCEEFGIRVTWNLIVGIPGEEPGWYPTMADRMRRLFHLDPPSGAGEFELHRFSPYFDAADEYSIVDLGAPDMFRLVFPFGDEIADDLSYRHDFALARDATVAEYAQSAGQVIQEWKTARARGATLVLDGDEETGAIVDTRWSAVPVRHELNPFAYRLYKLIASIKRESVLEQLMGAVANGPARSVSGIGTRVTSTLCEWDDAGLVWRGQNRVVALALDTQRRGAGVGSPREQLPSPVPYLR